MEKEILYAKNDLIFKRVFGDTRNIDILTPFLKSVLDIPHEEYDHIEIIDPNLKIDSPEDKLGILDVKLTTKNKNVIDIEIQLLKMDEMVERVLFYSSKMFIEQIKKGEDYGVIKRVISIIIVNYDMIKDSESYKHKYMLYDKQFDSTLTDLFQIYILELKKVPKESDGSGIYDWLSFLKATKKEELDMLATKNPELTKAVAVLKELSQDEQTRLLYESREKLIMDEQARMSSAELRGKEQGISIGKEQGINIGKEQGINIGKEQGINIGKEQGINIGKEQGINIGEKNKAIEVARKLLGAKLSIEMIIDATGLSKEEIENL